MKKRDKKEKDSLYWLTVYVLYSATLILLLVHVHKEKNTNNGYDYAVSYVNNTTLLATKVDKSDIAKNSTLNNVTAIKYINKAKMLSEYLKKRNKTKNTIEPTVEKTKQNIAITMKTRAPKLEQPENVGAIKSVEKNNAEFIESNNLSKETTADYSINQELVNNNIEKPKTKPRNQLDDGLTKTNYKTDSQPISILLETYNKYQSVRNSTISYSVDGSMEFVDITSTDMIADQLPSNIVTPLYYSRPMGAKTAEEDPLDGGGGVDNGGVYNDSGAGVTASLPITDGSNILIGLAILFIAIKQNNKLVILTKNIV